MTRTNSSKLKVVLSLVMLVLIWVSVRLASGSDLKAQCIEIITNGLTDKKEVIRLDSISSIEDNKLINEIIKEKIADMFLNDPSEVVRAASAKSFARIKGREAIPDFKQALKYRGPQEYMLHIAVSAALYNLGEKDALNCISKYLQSDKLAEAVEAAMAAGDLKDGSIVPLLKAKLRTNNRILKNELLISLAKHGEKISELEIKLLINSKEFDDQTAGLAIINLLKIKRFNENLTRMLYNLHHPVTRIRVAKVLTVLGDENKKDIIVEYLSSNEEKHEQDIRVVAMYEGLSAVGSMADLDVLKKYLLKDNRERIIAAATIIAILGR